MNEEAGRGPWARGPDTLTSQSVAVFRLHQLGQTREPHPRPGSGLLPLGPAAGAKVDSLDDGGLLVHTPADMAPF